MTSGVRAPLPRPIGALWAVLSMLVGTTCLFSFLQPVWVLSVLHVHASPLRAVQIVSHGPLVRCARTLVHPHSENSVTVDRHQCNHYGNWSHYLDSLPSASWRVACPLLAIGSALLFLLGLISLPTVCCPQSTHSAVTWLVGRLQTCAVALLAVGLLCIPAGLGAPQLQCGPEAGVYSLGDCKLGWAFSLGAMSTLLAMFCPMLARYTTFDPGHPRGSTWSLLSTSSWPVSLDEHPTFKREYYL